MIEEINKHIADLEKIKLKDSDELEKFRIISCNSLREVSQLFRSQDDVQHDIYEVFSKSKL